MAKKIKTALAPDLDLGGSWIVEWDAVDPVTGASVAGVVVSNTSLRVVGSQASLAALDVQPPLLAHDPSGANS
jgi:hypothetical protein